MKFSKAQTKCVFMASLFWICGLALMFFMKSFSLQDSCGIRTVFILHAIVSAICVACLSLWSCAQLIVHVKYEIDLIESSSAMMVFGIVFGNLTSTGLVCIGSLYFEFVISDCDRITKEYSNGPIFHCFFVIVVTCLVFIGMLVKPNLDIIQIDVEQPLIAL
jgi:hypothetical protein